jgi:hypothetical protein
MTKLLGALLMVGLQASTGWAQAHLLVVGGLGGEEKYAEEFYRWGAAMVDAARERYGLPAENVLFLAENPERDRARIAGESRRDDIERAIAAIARTAGPEDRVMILFFGHGSSDSRGSRINLPGPDLTAEDLAAMLSGLGSRPVAVVNTASASGGFHDALAGPNRTVVTATRSGMERNETIFGGFFVAAFTQDGADSNRDGRVTISEALDYAIRETERAYETGGRLQMEHARIEGDMELARVFHLGGAVSTAPPDASPAVRALYAERQRLEESIDALRGRSGQMDAEEYQRELERLLLELARTNRAIQEGSR